MCAVKASLAGSCAMDTDETLTADEITAGLRWDTSSPHGATVPDSSDESDGPLDFSIGTVGATVPEDCDRKDEPVDFARSAMVDQVSLPAPPESETSDSEEALPVMNVVPEDADTPEAGPPGWRPGQDVGVWIGRGTPLAEQGQVLAVNAYLVAKRLPTYLATALASHFGRQGHESRPVRVAAAFLGLARSAVCRIVKAVRDNAWTPRAEAILDGKAPVSSGKCDELAGSDAQLNALTVLVRAALSLGDDGYNSFTTQIARLALAGVNVGDRFHGPHFAQEAVFLAARCVQSMDVADLRATLPGIGIRSSVAILIDGVPVAGMCAYGRQGSVIVICCNSVSHRDGRLRPRMVTWAVPDGGHGGRATASAVLAALAEPSVGLRADELRTCLSLVGGDGAVALGGPDKKTPGTQAAEILWREVYGILVDPLRDLGDDAPLRALAGPPRCRAERDAWLLDAEHLHAATEWDKFHREDLALSRAVKAVPLAGELFGVCSLMDQWFNLGEGRLLVRKAAAIAGTHLRSGALPGVSRKVVALAREPAHLLQNFPAYALGVHGRSAHTRDGHHGPTIGSLVEGGRRLVSLDLVVFTTVFKDLMGSIVAPWGLAIQCSSVEPWALRRLQAKHERSLAAASSCLTFVRDFLRVLVLLRQHVPLRDLRAFVDALFYGTPSTLFCGVHGPVFGRAFPTLWGALNGFLHFDGASSGGYPIFRGVRLATVPPRDPDKWTCVGPHCQCTTRLTGRRPQSMRVRIPGKPRQVLVPHWVGNAGYAKSEWEAQARHTPVRFMPRLTADLGLMGRPSDANRLRAHIVEPHASRCMLPWSLVAAFEDIDAALSSATRFVDELRKQHDSLFGSEGASAGMRRVLDAMASAFDWEHVVERAPTPHAVEEFAVLARVLLPYLRHTEWPSLVDFPLVEHRWPDAPELKIQYVLMCRRLRSARRPPWWVLSGAVVEPVEVSGVPAWFVSVIFGPLAHYQGQPRVPRGLSLPPQQAEGPTGRALLARIAMVISAFLGTVPTRSFEVSLAALAFVGYPWRGRQFPHKMRGSVAKVWRCRLDDPVPGGLVTLVLPGMAGKLAYVQRVKRQLDWSAVSGALDANPFFSRGRRAGVDRSTWHAVRIRNFCRPMGSPEAVCERVGSLMHMQHSSTRHANAAVLMDEVLLRDAQVICVGHGRDERICQEVAACMLSMGRRPLIQAVARKRRRSDVPVSTAVVRLRAAQRQRVASTGRDGDSTGSSDSDCEDGHGDLSAWSSRDDLKLALRSRSQKATPQLSTTSVHAAFTSACVAGQVQQLPLFQEDIRANSSSRADTVKRLTLQEWLGTKAGQEWTSEKKRRRT